jgi:hypothetical protein
MDIDVREVIAVTGVRILGAGGGMLMCRRMPVRGRNVR